eukprot:XP_011522428.1 uncharacterized protein ENSP00000382042-like [Homo sapiens]
MYLRRLLSPSPSFQPFIPSGRAGRPAGPAQTWGKESTFETCLFMAVSQMSKWRLSRVGGSRSLPAEMEVLGEVWCVRAEEQPMTGLGIVWHSPLLDKALETWSLQQQPDFSLGLGHLGLGLYILASYLLCPRQPPSQPDGPCGSPNPVSGAKKTTVA